MSAATSEPTGGRDRGTERTLKKLGVQTGRVDLQQPVWELLCQGAEAKIFRGTWEGRRAIAKQRFVKKYRHPTLDLHLARERLRAEAKSNAKSRAAGVSSPELLLVDIDQRTLVMEEVAGSTLASRLKQLEKEPDPQDELQRLTEQLGHIVGKLHAAGVIHGDLTTSNILLREDGSLSVIDFGLSGLETHAEERAVDLYVLERALASSHPNAEPLLPRILEAYASTAGDKMATTTLAKLEEVRLRGRKRSMVG